MNSQDIHPNRYPMHLTWTSSVSAGILRAAQAMLAGWALVDRSLAAAIEAPAKNLADAVAASGLSAEFVAEHLMPVVAGSPGLDFAFHGRQLVTAALGRAGRRATAGAPDPLADALVELEATFFAACPRAAEELPLRREPLLGQWEARGPGLLAGAGRLTSADWLAPAATIVLVPPVLGGGGEAYPADRLATFEAVLANPIFQLPEVLRLGWILAQLPADLVSAHPQLGSPAWRKAVSLALVAVVLSAAEDVELASADRAHFQLALENWLGETAAAEKLWHWWQEYIRGGFDWPSGLDRLAQLLR